MAVLASGLSHLDLGCPGPGGPRQSAELVKEEECIAQENGWVRGWVAGVCDSGI